MNIEATAVQKKHLILGHPILWCFLSLPLSMILSQSLASLPKSLLANIMQQGDLREFVQELAGGVLYILIGLAFVKIGQRAYGKSFRLGFTAKRLKQSVLLSFAGLLLVVANIVPGILNPAGCVTGLLPVLSCFVSAAAVGFSEELCCRNFVLENMMQRYRDKKNGIVLTLVISSVGFGALHLLNLTVETNNPRMVFIQVFAAMVLGFFFGTVYIRTRNLWGPIIMHTLIDASSFLFNSAEQVTEPTFGLMMSYVVLSILLLGISVFMIRKSKWREVEEIWGSSARN